MNDYETIKARRKHRQQLILAILHDLFAAEHEWHVLVIKYSITHSYIELAIHKGSYPHNYYRIACIGTYYFAGHMRGGSYHLELAYDEGAKYANTTIKGNLSELAVECEEITGLWYIDGILDKPSDLSPEAQAQFHTLQTIQDEKLT